MSLTVPNVVFDVEDRGGEYMSKLNELAQAVKLAVQGVNGNAGLAATFDEYIQTIIPGYIGQWGELTGAASVDDVVYHAATTSLYRAVTAIADITASEPGGGNTDWELEGDRYATTAQGNRADAAHGWGNHAGAGYALSASLGSAAGATKATSDGDTNGAHLVDISWFNANARGGFKTASVQTFDDADEDGSNNISVTLNCSSANFFLLDFSDVSISSAGAITLNLTNYPGATANVVYGHIMGIRLGRKTALHITCSGKTVSWLDVPDDFAGGTTGMDNIHFYTSPLSPNKLLLSLNDFRASGYS